MTPLKFKQGSIYLKIWPQYIKRIEHFKDYLEIDVGTEISFTTYRTFKIELDEKTKINSKREI